MVEIGNRKGSMEGVDERFVGCAVGMSGEYVLIKRMGRA